MANPQRGAIAEIAEHRVAFSLSFIVLFGVAFLVLAVAGLTPDPSSSTKTEAANGTATGTAVETTKAETPVRLVIEDSGIDTTVYNPDTTNVDTLDTYLAKGAVRYPTSAQVGVDGTVLLFGHSSYLPIVHNQAYKTFNGIQDLTVGAVVHVYSADIDYRYKVTGVSVADANTDSIPLKNDKKYLTLVTCDSFSSKSSRYVVNASFVAAYKLETPTQE